MDTGDAAYLKTLETLWHDLVKHKMYITGGVGSRERGEVFGEACELPNAQVQEFVPAGRGQRSAQCAEARCRAGRGGVESEPLDCGNIRG